MGSSQLLEFLVALVVGVVAVLGALLCVGFLLVEPIRTPPSEDPTVSLADILTTGDCLPVDKSTTLPPTCSVDGNQVIPVPTCPLGVCTCDPTLITSTSVCCCRATHSEQIPNMNCSVAPITMLHDTSCGCISCDDLVITVELTVVAVGTENTPIPAAQVLRMEGDVLTPMGITNNQGKLVFVESVAERTAVYQVRATGYLSQATPVFNLLPSSPRISWEVMLMSSMNVEVGLGGAALSLRLGSMLSVSIPPLAFRDIHGNMYEDVVTFIGNVFDISNEAARPAIPPAGFEFSDPDTGEDVRFGMLVGMQLEFIDKDGLPLVNQDDLQISVSVMDDGDQDLDLSLLVYDAFLGQWNKSFSLSPLEPFRKKRQLLPVLFDGIGLNPLGSFNAIAAQRDIDCWLQARVFNLDGTAGSSSTVIMRQDATIGGESIFIQFADRTDTTQTTFDGLESNALCLPVACDNIVQTLLVARDIQTDIELLPDEFEDTVFDTDETTPIILSSTFLFSEIFLATTGAPRPFYLDVDACTAAGQETNANAMSADFFSFSVANAADLTSPADGNGDTCYIKIQIRDCFAGNVVDISSIGPVSGNIDARTIVTVVEPVPVTTDTPTTVGMTTSPLTTQGATTQGATTTAEEDFITMSGDGPDEMTTDPLTTTPPTTDTPTTDPPTTDPPTTDPPTTVPPTTEGPTGPFVCNANTATLRAACLEYVCGDEIRVLVRAAVDGQASSDFCTISKRSVLLQESPFSNENTQQLNVQAIVGDDLALELFTNDFNDPDLGLYTDANSGSPMGAMVALERCNAGLGEDQQSSMIDVTTGYAAVFTCFDE